MQKLTKSERAVAIAKDVIKHIHMMYVIRGTYCSKKLEPEELEKITDLQKDINKLAKKCNVCALGACFVSHVRLFDKLNLTDVITDDPDYGSYFNPDLDVIEKQLSDVFTERNLTLIESAFELGPMGDVGFGTAAENLMDAAIAFGSQYGDAKLRLKAIMQNVIDNNGQFRPQVRSKK